jgi:hypothetical protein
VVAAALALGALGTVALFSGLSLNAPPSDGPAHAVGPVAAEPTIRRPIPPVLPDLRREPLARPARGPSPPAPTVGQPVGEVPSVGPPPPSVSEPGTPPVVSPPVVGPPVVTPPTEPPVKPAAGSSCTVGWPGRSHVVHVRASDGTSTIKMTIVRPPGRIEAGRADTEGALGVTRWAATYLARSGCSLEPGTALGAAMTEGRVTALVRLPAERSDRHRGGIEVRADRPRRGGGVVRERRGTHDRAHTRARRGRH